MTSTVVPVFSWLLLILGISYLLQAETWIRLSRDALANTHQYYTLYLLLLITGLVVVTEHNTWSTDWNIVITVMGWGMVIKSVLFFVVPKWADPFARLLEKGYVVKWIRIVGIVLALVGAILVNRNVFNSQLF